jgi:hypothetical protein
VEDFPLQMMVEVNDMLLRPPPPFIYMRDDFNNNVGRQRDSKPKTLEEESKQ